MEGGHIQKRDGARSYWARQWAVVDPHVTPIAFSTSPDEQVVVEVRIENGLVKRFDIRGS
jgi:hypothetical protein